MHIGCDIVHINRIEEMIVRHKKTLSRLFTDQEIHYCQDRGIAAAASFAGTFAAKEAFFKALGTGFRTGKWTDVEIWHNDLGAPYFKFYGYYKETTEKQSLQQLSLTISHDGEYAIAFVAWE